MSTPASSTAVPPLLPLLIQLDALRTRDALTDVFQRLEGSPARGRAPEPPRPPGSLPPPQRRGHLHLERAHG